MHRQLRGLGHRPAPGNERRTSPVSPFAHTAYPAHFSPVCPPLRISFAFHIAKLKAHALAARLRMQARSADTRFQNMKDFIKFTPHALIIAVLAGLMQLLDLHTGDLFFAWIGFAAWACYFLAGCTIKGGVKVIGCWIGGVIASVMIIQLGLFLTESSGSASIGFPVSVALIAFLVILFEKVPALDFIPAWFVGAACFFGANTLLAGNYEKSVPVVLISCAVGQIFGWVTVTLRTKYGSMIGADKGAATE